MNPSTTSLGSHHGADELDEQDEQFEYIQQDTLRGVRTETRHEDDRAIDANVTIPAGRKAPYITPKIAPPKITRRYSTTETPEVGVWVVVNVQDGKRTETLQGRVAVIDTHRIRLRQGAGWWEIPLGTVISISAGDDPAHRGR
jgi:hypothetical protein